MLTPGQKAHYDTFGFLVLRQLFSQEEIAIMKRESVEIFDEDRDGRPFTEDAQEQIVPFFERKPFMSTVAGDDRIYNVAADLLGPEFILVGTAGTLHVGDTRWHSSVPPSSLISQTKFNFYLEPVSVDSGCLRVVPGSHHVGSPDLVVELRRTDDSPDFRPFGVAPWEIPSCAIESQPGDVVVFTENVAHASFGGQAGRHRHEITFMADPKTENQVTMIQEMYDKANYSLHPAESYVNSDSPRLRRMVSKLVEWGFETSKV